MCRGWGAKSLASLYALGVRAGFAFLALSQALLSRVSDVLFMIFMDEISRCRKGLESVQFSDITAAPLLFADDIVLWLHWTLQRNILLFPKCETVILRKRSDWLFPRGPIQVELYQNEGVVVKGTKRLNGS